MEDIKKKYNSIDWVGLRRSAGKLKARAASNFKDMVMTDIENNVRAATSDTSWGATGAEMEAIARATFIREEYPLVMGIVWERISSKKWRNVYKALDLLKYLCLHGSQRCCDEARDAVPHMQALVHFRYVDTAGKDEGRNVRERAKQLLELLQSPEMMREERERSKALRAKIGDGSGKVAAVSSDDYRYGGGPSASQSHYGGGGGAEQDFHDREYGGGTDADYTSAGYQGGAYGEYDYGEHVDQNGESSNVNTGLDDLLGLSDAPYEAPKALPSTTGGGASGTADDLFFGADNDRQVGADEDDMFDGFHGAQTQPLDSLGNDFLSALPAAPAAAPATTGFGGMGESVEIDLFGDLTSTKPTVQAPPHSGFDLSGSAAPTASTAQADLFSAPTVSATSASSSVPQKKQMSSGGLDVFGDLVNFDNIGQSSRPQKKHDVHSGTSLNAIASSSSSTAVPSSSSKDNKNNHDLLFGL